MSWAVFRTIFRITAGFLSKFYRKTVEFFNAAIITLKRVTGRMCFQRSKEELGI
jgi:hypothetical protein